MAGWANLPDVEVQKLHDPPDRVDQRRRETAREQESDRAPAAVYDERSAIPAFREHVADDLVSEDRRLPAIIHLNDRVESRHAAFRHARRAPALPDPQADAPGRGSRGAADPDHGRRAEPRAGW